MRQVYVQGTWISVGRGQVEPYQVKREKDIRAVQRILEVIKQSNEETEDFKAVFDGLRSKQKILGGVRRDLSRQGFDSPHLHHNLVTCLGFSNLGFLLFIEGIRSGKEVLNFKDLKGFE